MSTEAKFATSLAGLDALVIGAAQKDNETDAKPDATPSFSILGATGGLKEDMLAKVDAALKASKFGAKKSDVRTLFAVSDEVPILTVVGLGKEETDAAKKLEQARVAAGSAISSLRGLSPNQAMSIGFAPFADAQGLAEGAVLVQHSFDELKQASSRSAVSTVTLLTTGGDAKALEASWSRGLVLADSQNVARRLAETPANLMTPTIFCERVKDLFEGHKNVTLHIREPAWIAEKKMGSFESVGRGSSEPQRLLEIHYAGDPAGWEAKKVALVGKGVTFDSGGISIKPADGMVRFREKLGRWLLS
jgi:aminopeptidase